MHVWEVHFLHFERASSELKSQLPYWVIEFQTWYLQSQYKSTHNTYKYNDLWVMCIDHPILVSCNDSSLVLKLPKNEWQHADLFITFIQSYRHNIISHKCSTSTWILRPIQSLSQRNTQLVLLKNAHQISPCSHVRITTQLIRLT